MYMSDITELTITEMLDLNETIAASLFEGKTYPWEVLSLIHDFVIFVK